MLNLLLSLLVLPRSRRRRIPTSSSTRATRAPATASTSCFLAGDHEYRSEESLPALARILAKHYGFKCSVFFTIDPEDRVHRTRAARTSPGLEALKTADLLVVFLRFQDFPDDQMQHIVDYLDRGGPVVGFRTATHAFQIKRPDAKFLKYDWQNKGEFAGRVRPADPRRDVGVALRHQSQAELAAAARAVAGEPSDPARREGRVGAVGRLHRRIRCSQHDPRARADSRTA